MCYKLVRLLSDIDIALCFCSLITMYVNMYMYHFWVSPQMHMNSVGQVTL